MRLPPTHPAGAIAAFAITLLAAGCSVITAAPRDHYDPTYLNEAAATAWARGDRATAIILLERATVLAPDDRRIRGNLDRIKGDDGNGTWLHSDAAPIAVPAPATAAPATPVVGARPMPDIGIWPLK